MAQRREIIREVGSDGLEVLSNLTDRYTGEDVRYKETVVNFEGTVITDADVIRDGGIVLIKKFGKYFKRVFDAINVKWYGAKGDNSTDDTIALKRVETMASALSVGYLNGRVTVLFPFALGYICKQPLIFPNNISVLMEAPLIVDHEGTGLTLGSSNEVNFFGKFRLSVKKRTLSSWTSEDSLGMKLINMNTCDVMIDMAYGFTRGVLLDGDTNGFSYNFVNLGYLTNNKIGIDMYQSGQGWVNENLFLNGRWAIDGTIHTTLSRYGVRMRTVDPNFGHNNNVFIKPSWELKQNTLTGDAESVGMLFEQANQNEVILCRSEGNKLVARFTGVSTENKVSIGYGRLLEGDYYEDLSLYPNNIVVPSRKRYLYENTTTILDASDLVNRWIPYDALTDSFRGLAVLNPTGGLSRNQVNLKISRVENKLTSSTTNYAAIGIVVDTTKVKSFVIKNSIPNVAGGIEGVVKCFDENMTPLAQENTDKKVFSTSNLSVSYQETRFGGSYISTPTDSEIFIRVAQDVKYIFIGIRLRNTSVINGFSIGTYDNYNSPALFDAGLNYLSNEAIALAAPNRGLWNKGMRVYNDSTVAGQPLGWICNKTGEYGTAVEPTWLPFGSVGAIQIASLPTTATMEQLITALKTSGQMAP